MTSKKSEFLGHRILPFIILFTHEKNFVFNLTFASLIVAPNHSYFIPVLFIQLVCSLSSLCVNSYFQILSARMAQPQAQQSASDLVTHCTRERDSELIWLHKFLDLKGAELLAKSPNAEKSVKIKGSIFAFQIRISAKTSKTWKHIFTSSQSSKKGILFRIKTVRLQFNQPPFFFAISALEISFEIFTFFCQDKRIFMNKAWSPWLSS